MIGPWRVDLAAMGPSSAVMGLIAGQDHPQVSFTEDQHPVGDLGLGGEHGSIRISVRARAPGRDVHRLDTSSGQDRVR